MAQELLLQELCCVQLLTGSWGQLLVVFNLEPNPESRRAPELLAAETSWRCWRSVDWGEQHLPGVEALGKCLPSSLLTRNTWLRSDCDRVPGPAEINLGLFPVLGAFPVSLLEQGCRKGSHQTPQAHGQGQRQQCSSGVISSCYSSLVPAAITHPLSHANVRSQTSLLEPTELWWLCSHPSKAAGLGMQH